MQQILLLVAFLAALCSAPPPGLPIADRAAPPDVVVYGGTAGGVICAVQLARLGRKVVLLEATDRIGGMTTCGLGATDIGNKAAIGGLSREFYRRVRAHYESSESWVQETREEFAGHGHVRGEDTAWTFEPKVALAILEQMLAEVGVEVVHRARLDLGADGVVVAHGRIATIRTTDRREFHARYFVDATYEGDLLAKAGVSFRVGREGNDEFGETLNGVQVGNATKHQFDRAVDPFVIPADKSSGPLAGVRPAPPGPDGSADGAVQAYCFRLCTTDVDANRVPWPKPDRYDERDYELLLRNFEAGDRRVPWHRVLMPNRKTDTNNNFAISTDVLGLSWRWPEADWTERDALFATHLGYTQGLMWTLANHPRVPASVREEFRTWGLSRDEFVDSGHWPAQVYVREGRRMVGEVVMTEHHCRGDEVVRDPVGLGAYGMDSHNVQRYVADDGSVRNEGDVQVHGFQPYGISYRAIVPRHREITNLVVPVAISSTHIAFGSLRMEPVFMVLGHSAATAIDLALRSGADVQEVSYPDLRTRLLDEAQVLEWTVPPAAPSPGIDPKRIPGVVVDDASAQRRGSWTESTSIRPFIGDGYLHDDAAGDGNARIRFELSAPAAGPLVVELAWQAHPNRASAVPVNVRHGDRSIDLLVDQRQPHDPGAFWHEVARIDATAGQQVVVELQNRATRGYVVIDAARLRARD